MEKRDKIMNTNNTFWETDENKILNDHLITSTNKQYSYITRESIALSITEKPGWLLSKDGQTINQTIEGRVSQQATAAKLSTPTIISKFVVENNDDVKLDDKIRNEIFKTKLHQSYNYVEVGGGREWTYTYVGDIYDELNISPKKPDDILNNKLFLELLGKRMQKSKENVSLKVLGLKTKEVLILRPWQDDVVTEMIDSKKKTFLLSLPPRFGKTISVLKYCSELVRLEVYSTDELYLVPLSKNLASNRSFVKDYKEYFSDFNIIEDISLFKDEAKIIEKLKELLPKNAKVISVTDEADLASHTTISIDKMKQIESEFNVVEKIAMTGTGIGKASKIFKGVPIDKICYIHKTYSELGEMSHKYVKRNFINVKYEIDALSPAHSSKEKKLNIRQSFQDASKYESLSDYLYFWTLNDSIRVNYGLQKTEVIMVYVSVRKITQLRNFAIYFGDKYSDECKTMVLSGQYTTNGKSEDDTLEELDTMRKNKDTRKLIVFTAGMASRSYSVGPIYRTILFSDTKITNAKLQFCMRACTYEGGKHTADIIRIGFTDFEMDTEIIMLENNTLDYSNNSKSTISMFLSNNSFTSVVIDPLNNQFKDTVLNNSTAIASLLDNIMKFKDRSEFWIPRLHGLGIVVSAPGKKNSTNKTASVSTSGKRKPTKNVINKKIEIATESEEDLKTYINVGRCIPSLASIQRHDNIDDFLNNGDWERYLKVDKREFKTNLEIESFRGFIDSGFVRCSTWTEKKHQKRIVEYLQYI